MNPLITCTLRRYAYLAGFFLTVHLAFSGYINSSFLENAVGDIAVGWVFAIASLISIIGLNFSGQILCRLGSRNFLIILAILGILATAGLLWPPADAHWLIALIFIAYYSLGLLLRFVLDVYLEQVSDNSQTGGIRGVFMTAVNLAWLASPLLASRLIGDGDFRPIYLISGLALFPLLWLTWKKFDDRRLPPIKIQSTWKTLRELLIHRREPVGHNIFNILVIDFLLNFFYAVMVIYSPIYLTEIIGLSWPEIGVIFTIMLIPFVIFELPLGKIADKWLGEKEILTGGLLLLVLSTAFIPFIAVASVPLWATILFLTRSGAASVEIMKETYLFKNVNPDNAGIIGLARNNSPLAYLIAPIVATAWLAVFPFKFLFLLLAAIMLIGFFNINKLVDTK